LKLIYVLAQKWLDLAEIWYTCSLTEYLEEFFSFCENFHFGPRGPNWPENYGEA